MPKVNTYAELSELRGFAQRSLGMQKKQVLICAGTGCVAGGSLVIYDRIKKACEERGLDVCVELRHEPHGENIGL
ncbi:MAG: (2Fe-2S) ferredoxin domain-containing protein, partial [Anaerotruncus rubiinfantis]